MSCFKLLKKYFLLLLVITAVLATQTRTPLIAGEAKSPQAHASSAPEADADLDHAFAEFKASAERLGKSMAKRADDDTSEARLKILKTMNKAILELSHTMNRAATQIDPAAAKKSDK